MASISEAKSFATTLRFSFSDGEVMARLIHAVFEGVEDYLLPLVQLLGELEFYLGALSFRDGAEARGLAVCLPELVGPDEPRELVVVCGEER